MIGDGARVNVVKDDIVIPLKIGVARRSHAGDVDVATTTEWGIVRMSRRRWDESGGSFGGGTFAIASSTSFCLQVEQYWRFGQPGVLEDLESSLLVAQDL